LPRTFNTNSNQEDAESEEEEVIEEEGEEGTHAYPSDSEDGLSVAEQDEALFISEEEAEDDGYNDESDNDEAEDVDYEEEEEKGEGEVGESGNYEERSRRDNKEPCSQPDSTPPEDVFLEEGKEAEADEGRGEESEDCWAGHEGWSNDTPPGSSFP